jgi:hypothetical protein
MIVLDERSPDPEKIMSDVVKERTDASSAVQSAPIRAVRVKYVHSAPDPNLQDGRPRVHIPNWGLVESDRFMSPRICIDFFKHTIPPAERLFQSQRSQTDLS